ncbi:MAG: Rrf2 family transcriptional regulator [Deinococcales bacterium]
MWISTRAQYGMRALVEIALNGERPTSLKSIADEQHISQHYLEQIVAVLRKAGIVESIRGAQGGYRLAKKMQDITALEVVELMEGSLAPVACLEDEAACEHTGQCSTENLWQRVDQAVRRVLSETNLAQLVAERGLIQLESPPEYLYAVSN